MRRCLASVTGALLLSAVLAGHAAAQQSPAIPDLGAPAGAIATARLDRPFDRYALPVAPFGSGNAQGSSPLLEIDGRVIWSAYRLEKRDATTASVMTGYRTQLAAMGFQTLLDCATSACGGFDFRFGVALLPAPAMVLDTADFAQLSASQTAVDGSESFVSVLVSRVLGAVQIQTVMVVHAEAGSNLATAPVDGQVLPAMVPPQDTQTLLDRLTSYGHVTLQGLEFVTGGVELSQASAPALDITARVLSEHPDLGILIIGHSDNQGGLDTNVALSNRRAEAVRAALIERGIARDRLEAHGIGYLAPVASNATPEGRALNRRVELVLR